MTFFRQLFFHNIKIRGITKQLSTESVLKYLIIQFQKQRLKIASEVYQSNDDQEETNLMNKTESLDFLRNQIEPQCVSIQTGKLSKFPMTSNHRKNCSIGQLISKKCFFSPGQFGPRRKRKGKSGEIRSLLETLGGTPRPRKNFFSIKIFLA